MFKDTNEGQTYHDPEAERKAREHNLLKELEKDMMIEESIASSELAGALAIKKRKYPQEMLLMNGCPQCGLETNRNFVENIIDEITTLAFEAGKARAIFD